MILFRFISTVCFIGYSPVAPGTFGTLAAFIFMYFIRPQADLHLILFLLLIPVGIVSSEHEEKFSGKKDPRHVVIDEFAGYIASLLFLPLSPKYMVAAFILFRIFDIVKPPPIRRIERLKSGLGIMADDIMAALFTNAVLQVWRFLSI